MNETILDNSFLLDIVRSGPASIVVINKDDLKIEFSNEQFRSNFYSNTVNEAETISSLSQLLDSSQQERLKIQLQNVSKDTLARNKYMVYRLQANDVYSQVYIYASPLSQASERGQELYELLLLLDISTWHLPFISFDTRELFFKQFNDIDFGTFEWLIEQDKVFWTDGIYKIYEEDPQKTQLDLSIIKNAIHHEDRVIANHIFEDPLRSGDDIDIEYRIITRNNNIKTIHTLGKIIYNDKGKPEKLVGSIKDVSTQRKTEEDLRNSVKVLNRSNKDLEEFAYVASHDLQEPLRKISTFSDRLNEKYKDVLTGDGIMYLERMMASAESMRSLINNLLEFSRISRSTIPFASINLNFILQQVKTDLELTIDETGTVIRSTQLPTIHASMTQMKQLFENIISNAIKFRDPHIVPAINIASRSLTSEEVFSYELPPGVTYHKIEITDNGIGFEDEYALRIFQIFQRLHGKTEYPGSGIGLAICKKIIEHHNGIIYAENLPTIGARFTFILPEHNQIA